MKRIASLLMLAARSTLWKAAGITLASCLTEAGLFLAALSGWQDTVRTAYYEYSNPMGLEGLLMQYPLSWCFRIGLVLVCAVLAFLGWEGSSRVSYTLRRLSVGHRALTLLWAGYGFFCLLFFWAAHLGTLLALCAAALPRLAPEFSGPQALFLACYRDPYLHSLLPLDDWPLWARNLSMCAALGTSAACFSFQRRMGRRAFAVLPLAALSALCFPLSMGSFEFGGPATAFSACCSSGRPTWAPCWLSAPPPSPVWHRSSPAPRLCSWPATATPISTACCPWMTGLSGRATCPCAPPWGRRRPVSPSNDAWAAGPSPFCPWRRSPPSAFPCPWAPLNLAGRRSSSAPISTTAFSTPRTVCPPSWGPSCFLSACAPWPPPSARF